MQFIGLERRLPAFAEVEHDADAGMAAEFIRARAPRTYGRYANWWRDIPSHEVRTLR